ncbi:MAG: CHASE2 domain-containing protein, partial [Candidatus Omnitrophica bacterium]|nr:CHASE2 domain-containing protein [Candidatus Omnitrophota bacterium]
MANLKVVIKKVYIVAGLAILLTAGYTFAVAKIPLFQILRESTTDLLIQQRRYISPLPKAIKDITIVTIDEGSLKRLRQRWPMSRGIYASFIKRLSFEETKPLTIGMDLFFSGPSEISEDDVLLAEAMKKSANSIIVSYLNETGVMIEPEDILTKSAAGVGFVSAPRDNDLVVRETYPMMFLANGSFVYSFPLLTYTESRGIDLDKAFYRATDACFVTPDVEGRDGILKIPLDSARRTMRINYFAKTEDFKTIPLWEALVSSAAENIFKNKIVLIGTIVEIHHDVYPTPLGIMPGVVINANIVMNIISKRWLVLLPLWVMFSILLAGALAVSGVTYRFGVLKGAAVSVCLAGGAFLLASSCMQYDRIFDLFGFVLIVISSFTGVSIWMGLLTLI